MPRKLLDNFTGHHIHKVGCAVDVPFAFEIHPFDGWGWLRSGFNIVALDKADVARFKRGPYCIAYGKNPTVARKTC